MQSYFVIFYIFIIKITNAELTNNAVTREDNSKCADLMNKYFNGLITMKPWAIRMFDANGKLPPGLMNGNSGDLGDFDLCLSVEKNDKFESPFDGKYCLGSLNVNLDGRRNAARNLTRNLQNFKSGIRKPQDISFHWAICIPDGCKGEEAADYLSKFLKVNVTGQEIMCQTRKSTSQPFTPGAIVTIILFSAVLCVMLTQTVYDVYLQHTKKKPRHPILIAFSILTNGRKLLRVVKSEEQLSCLNGMRVLSMMWVVIGHRYFTTVSTLAVTNLLDLLKWADSWHSMYIVSATLSVDTFFLMGGLLLAYGFLKMMDKGQNFNIPLFYLHRYIRLTPVLVAVILISITLIPYMGIGPWHYALKASFQDICANKWWAALLYVQNYVDTMQMCIGQTWYLSVDMQLFVLSPIVLIPLRKWPKYTLGFVVLLIAITMGLCFWAAWHYHLSALLTDLTSKTGMDYGSKYYFPTHTRAGPWLIGIILGYYIYQIKSKKLRIKLNKYVVLGLWIVTLLVLGVCIFGAHGTLRGPEYNKWGNALHITLVRPVWAIGVAWIILACISGYGGPVNSFLSHPTFQVLSRFTYSIFIIHELFLVASFTGMRQNVRFSDYEMFYMFLSDFVICTALSLGLCLAFESPMITIEKLIFGNARKEARDDSPDV